MSFVVSDDYGNLGMGVWQEGWEGAGSCELKRQGDKGLALKMLKSCRASDGECIRNFLNNT